MARNMVTIVSAVLFLVLAALLAITPVPYVTWGVGPTYNVLSQTAGRAVLTVEGLRTFPANGELLLSTVIRTRADTQVSLPEALLAHWGSSSQVLPRNWVYQPGKSSEQMHAEDSRAFVTARRDATVAALRQAGHPVTELPMVSSVAVAGPAFDKLIVGDMIVKVDGLPVATADDVRAAITRTKVGDPVLFEVLRGREKLAVQVTTTSSNIDRRVPVTGANYTKGYLYGPNVVIGVDEAVVGADGGLVFALGIYDLISEGDLLGGQVVGATGTIDADGIVGPVSGIKQRVAAAQAAKASVFLVPAKNCMDLAGVETPMKLVRVETLSDAIDSVSLLADPQHASKVPVC